MLGAALLLAAAPSSASPPSPARSADRAEPVAAAAAANLKPVRPAAPPSSPAGVRDLGGPVRATADPGFEPHTVLVRFKAGTSASARGQVASRVRGKVSGQAPVAGYVKITTAGPAADALEVLRADAAVVQASLDHRRTVSKTPNDPFFPDYQKYLATIRLPQAWDVLSTATTVTIAVVDTGVDTGHPDLAGRTVPGYNAVANNSDVTDRRGHGTMVAGIAAANTNNGLGVAGAAYQGRIMPIMVFSGEYAYDSDIAEGVIWAVDHGAKVVNMSLGGAGETPVLHDAIKYAVGKGVLVVVSAGNTGDDSPHYPAMYPEVLTVGATDVAASITDFSSWGEHVDLAAPGYKIMSTYSRTASGGAYTYASGAGTSFSAPLVAGVAALTRAKYPSLTPAQVIERLKATARDAGPRGIDPYYGHGIVDAYAALGGAPTTAFAMSPVDGDDAPTQARPLTTQLTGWVGLEGDVDWYRYEVPAASRVFVRLTAPIIDEYRAHNFEPMMWVYDTDLRLVTSAAGHVATEGVGGVWGAGTYYIKVHSRNASTDDRSYTLHGSRSPTVDGDFPPFAAGVERAVGRAYAHATAIGDVTGDGRPDVLLTTDNYADPQNDCKLFVFPQRPDGSFDPPRRYDTRIFHDNVRTNWAPIAILDVNGDGRDDVALATGNGVELFAQAGDGTLQPGVLVPDTAGSQHIAAGDMDGDGDTDLVYSAGAVYLLTQSGGGTFTRSLIASGGTAREVEIGDLNGDGRLDVASPVEGGVNAHLAGPGGWTTVKQAHGSAGTLVPRGIEVADLNGDGRADIAATLPAPDTWLQVFHQQPDGTLRAAPLQFSHAEPGAVEAGDWDHDGRTDLFVAHGEGGLSTVAMYRQLPAGTLAVPQIGEANFQDDVWPNVMAVGDLDGDGYPDIAAAAGYADGLWTAYNVNGIPAQLGPQLWVRGTGVPAFGSLGRTPRLTVSMQRELDPATVNGRTVRLLDGRTGKAVDLPVSYDPATRTITVTLVREARRPGAVRPAAPVLLPDRSYRLVLDGVADTGGELLTGYTVWYVA
ncbi:hypothetical protein Cba03nite_25950 [Catellatospora bangladeshensis]|uniref:Peptidase S8/S53 domain-containing protein n=1 Tax=Catellatospora bangladeshensis TaxID=310355 RepID=A0A8J3JBK8_9ACTN|nr:hypothetical protein Cba03nite_25950 [Catellatospora bangladeshensis]